MTMENTVNITARAANRICVFGTGTGQFRLYLLPRMESQTDTDDWL